MFPAGNCGDDTDDEEERNESLSVLMYGENDAGGFSHRRYLPLSLFDFTTNNNVDCDCDCNDFGCDVCGCVW